MCIEIWQLNEVGIVNVTDKIHDLSNLREDVVEVGLQGYEQSWIVNLWLLNKDKEHGPFNFVLGGYVDGLFLRNKTSHGYNSGFLKSPLIEFCGILRRLKQKFHGVGVVYHAKLWEPPSARMIKINVDGIVTWDFNVAVVDGVMRDNDGFWVCGFENIIGGVSRTVVQI